MGRRPSCTSSPIGNILVRARATRPAPVRGAPRPKGRYSINGTPGPTCRTPRASKRGRAHGARQRKSKPRTRRGASGNSPPRSRATRCPRASDASKNGLRSRRTCGTGGTTRRRKAAIKYDSAGGVTRAKCSNPVPPRTTNAGVNGSPPRKTTAPGSSEPASGAPPRTPQRERRSISGAPRLPGPRVSRQGPASAAARWRLPRGHDARGRRTGVADARKALSTPGAWRRSWRRTTSGDSRCR
jgi:hypothetical protein